MVAKPTLETIALAQIRPDPTQSRTDFDAVKLEELKKSLVENGLINPIAVRKTADALFEITAGERRYRSAALLGWKTIECRVYPADTPALETEYISLVENLQREDLNPIEEARGYFQLTQPPYNQSQVEIAARVGVGRDVISRALSLLELPAPIQNLLARANISPGHARVLAKITNVSRQIELATKAAQEGWTIRRLEEEARLPSKKGGAGAAPTGGRSVFDLFRRLHADPKPEADRDPLEGMWPNLKLDEELKSISWEVEYHDKEWFFALKRPPGSEPELTMARWLHAMARWFEPMLAGKEDSPVDAADAPKPQRLPKTDVEMNELIALAQAGPRPVYAWLYGADSPVAQSLQNAAWTDLGASDPTQAVKELIEGLRRMHKNTPSPAS